MNLAFSILYCSIVKSLSDNFTYSLGHSVKKKMALGIAPASVITNRADISNPDSSERSPLKAYPKHIATLMFIR